MIWFLEINSENFALFDNPTPRKILQFLYDNMTWSVPPTRSIGINISNEAKRGRLGSYERHLTKYRIVPSRVVSFRRSIDRSIQGLRAKIFRTLFVPSRPTPPTTRPAHFYPRNPDRDIPFHVTSTFYLLGLDRSVGSGTIRAPSLYRPCRSRDRVPD